MVDQNRGVTMRDTPNGIRVVMYKDDPGVFYDIHDNPLDTKFAKEAGFNVARLLAQRKQKQELEALRAKQADELAKEEARLRDEAEKHGSVSEAFRVVKDGGNRFNVMNVQTGERVSEHTMSRSEAEELLASMEGGSDGG